jgi:hypothetical protein
MGSSLALDPLLVVFFLRTPDLCKLGDIEGGKNAESEEEALIISIAPCSVILALS